MFADDTSIIVSSANNVSLQNDCQTVLDHLYNWMTLNKIKVNAQKTKYMTFKNNTNLTLIYDGTYLENSWSNP